MVTQAGTAPYSLKFRDKLLVKTQSSDALLKKMKVRAIDAPSPPRPGGLLLNCTWVMQALHAELCGIDQENIDTKSLSSIRKELIDKSILLHRDKGVKAYAACCMADLLRLYAPDAPYTALELKVSLV